MSAISASAGSLIGGLTTGFTSLLTQRSQARAGMIAHDLARREDLVMDFIVAASTTYGDAIVNNEPKDAGDCRSLRYGQPDARDVDAAIGRLRGHCQALDPRDLFRAQSDQPM